MEDIRKGMNKIFNTSILTSVIILVLGIFLFVEPDLILNMISIVLGIIILIPGITSLIDYLKNKNQTNLITGVVTVIIGLILIVNTKIVASILPFVLGIYFVVNGINHLMYCLELRKQNIKNTGSLVISIFIIICGVLFVANPFEGALVITKIMGIFMIVYAVLDIINFIIIKKEMNVIHDNIIEAQIEEKTYEKK